VLTLLQSWNLLKAKINSFNSSNSYQDSFFHGIIWADQNNSYNKVIEVSKKKSQLLLFGEEKYYPKSQNKKD